MPQEYNKNSQQTRIEKIHSMLEQQPNDCFLLHALGLEQLKEGELQLAEQSFQRVLAVNESYVGTYYHLAKTQEKLNQPQLAIATYEKGIYIAQQVKDRHAQNELQMALDDLIDD